MKIFCIGIGGIGLSALARYYKHEGHSVAGSDAHDSELLQTLREEGISVSLGTDAKHITDDIDLVVYTAALPDTHEELLRAKKYGIKHQVYAEALGEITQEKETIAICGTHGKTTTTAMVYYALKACGVNPTIIVGSIVGGVGSNFIPGDSRYLVVEACEYKRSFLYLHPRHVIVTNIDEDHLDYYKDLAEIRSAFTSFVQKLGVASFLVTHSNLGLDSRAQHVDADCVSKDDIQLSVLGNHNKQNAQLVIALLTSLSFPDEDIRRGLASFTGTWRRLEYKGTQKGAQLYDDYGHHPREIEATISALREKYMSGKFKLIVVFQPHLYSRTKLLLDDFAKAFTLSDMTCVLPIYAAREVDDGTISSLDLVEKMDRAIYVESFDEVKKYLDKHAHSGSVVLTLGAGDVYRLYDIYKTE